MLYNMQNSDISSAQYIDEDNSDLPRAISLGNTTDIDETKKLTKTETVQSDPEQQAAKTKTQSRFSSAIRKLSGSTRKKKSTAKKKDKEPTTDNVLSSGGEDTPLSGSEESAKKNKNKLSKRFHLGSLGKSKRAAVDEEAKDLNTIADVLAAAKSVEISKTREVTSELEHTIKTPDITEISPTPSLPGSPRRLDRIQKVQITISGKKIEHTKIDKKQRSITTTTTQISGGARSETDYLIPSTAGEVATTSPQAVEETLEAAENTVTVKKDIKQKCKKPADATLATTVIKTTTTTAIHSNDLNDINESPATPAPTTITHTQTATATAESTKPSKATSERLVIITQSKYDKPAASEQAAPPKPSRTSEITATKTPSSRTAATLKLPTITKKLKSKTSQQSGTQLKSKGKTGITEAETNLMQNPAGTPQRGHRFPKPATTANTTTDKTTIENPIEFQLQSHAAQTLSTTESRAQPHSLRSTGPPSYSPPPIPAVSSLKETLSAEAAQATRYTSSLLIEPKTTATVTLAPLANISETVVSVSNSSTADDKVSSAESVLPKDYTEQPRVQFAVGSAVRPQPKIVSLDIDLDYDLDQQLDSVGSNLSSDSATPVSDSSRKRIRYIAEPSITEEHLQSFANRRVDSFETANLAQQHKYSLDSDYDYEALEHQQMPGFGDLSMDQEMEPVRKAFSLSI